MSDLTSSHYAPKVTYLCDDPDCCWNGCPIVVCQHCGKEWPCPDYRASHTKAQINAQRRWVIRVESRPDDGLVKWRYRKAGCSAQPSRKTGQEENA